MVSMATLTFGSIALSVTMTLWIPVFATCDFDQAVQHSESVVSSYSIKAHWSLLTMPLTHPDVPVK